MTVIGEAGVRARRERVLAVYAVVVGLLAVSAALSLTVGHGDLADAHLRSAVLELRGSRLAAAFLAGAALAVGGVMVQGLFRNPLASPSVIGATAGAALGGRLALLFFRVLLVGAVPAFIVPDMFVPVGCVVGALAALLILLVITRARDDLVVLLLAGFLLSSLFMSLGGFVMSLAQDHWEVARTMVIFALGDVTGVGPRQILLVVPLVVGGIAAAWLWGRSLDVMLSGEDEASALGVEIAAVRRWIVVWTALLTGAAVAIGGSVGFVGLVVPHVLRPFLGAGHRRLVPAAALLGGTFLVACDVVCRVIPSRSEVPLGVVTGLVGAPVFLVLLVRARRRVFDG